MSERKYLYCIDNSIEDDGAVCFIALVEEEFFKERGCLDSVHHEVMDDLPFPAYMEAVYESYKPVDETRAILNAAGFIESAELAAFINGTSIL